MIDVDHSLFELHQLQFVKNQDLLYHLKQCSKIFHIERLALIDHLIQLYIFLEKDLAEEHFGAQD